MTDSRTRIARLLAYAGILPPWLALMVHLTLGRAGLDFAALSYGAIIASFVCGLHWGVYMPPSVPIPVNLFITSNIGALAAWLMVLVASWSFAIGCIGLVLVLFFLLLIDHRLLTLGVHQPWFWTLRRNATLGLGAALIVWSFVA